MVACALPWTNSSFTSRSAIVAGSLNDESSCVSPHIGSHGSLEVSIGLRPHRVSLNDKNLHAPPEERVTNGTKGGLWDAKTGALLLAASLPDRAVRLTQQTNLRELD